MFSSTGCVVVNRKPSMLPVFVLIAHGITAACFHLANRLYAGQLLQTESHCFTEFYYCEMGHFSCTPRHDLL